ncbi:hypothetical protein LDENG_00043740 [Lucifuga dentata]|nr:hypothetical protein LDENG_00043740 [Lucifuga dentata]
MVHYIITQPLGNVGLHDSEIYWASVVTNSGLAIESKKVQLIVQEKQNIVLIAGLLAVFIWRIKRIKDQQQQQISNVTAQQETTEASRNVPASSLVYSVLDFPRRPQSAAEIQPTDTEYATISYPPEQNGGTQNNVFLRDKFM